MIMIYGSVAGVLHRQHIRGRTAQHRADHGFSDLECYGSEIETSTLDRLTNPG